MQRGEYCAYISWCIKRGENRAYVSWCIERGEYRAIEYHASEGRGGGNVVSNYGVSKSYCCKMPVRSHSRADLVSSLKHLLPNTHKHV
jgi:hypothetical protein